MGLLCLAWIIVAYKTKSCGFSCTQSGEETPAYTSTIGEKNMPTALSNGKIQHATDATFQNSVLKSDVPVLVDFYADWCGPCRALAPILEELAAENLNVKIVKVNVDQNAGLAAEYGIESIPSLKLFKNGRITDELVGLASKNQLRALLSR
jgi:thioredoxin 1